MILDEIAARTRLRVAKAREIVSAAEVYRQAAALAGRGAGAGTESGGTAAPFARALAAPGLSFICEVKRASPSKGLIAADFPYLQIAKDYEAAGAAAISVLTEPEFFRGSDRHLREIAAGTRIPVLRKDFIIDASQICEAKLLGASAVLLICALLDTETLASFIKTARELELSALVEIHNEAEADSALKAGALIAGINNRDLRTFEVDLGLTARLRKLLPPGVIVVAESGVRTPADIRMLEEQHVDAVLVGESLMRAPDKKKYLAELRSGLRQN
ncbi:MAG: indole-3-glycerol phosphate synthase TrpC [Treponema sp.]|jgi:indole-3-glycerol phosphate synthase|nr:indole-3-glycerol phosphate synthase TrpC [Treponema sp.]